MRDKGPKGPEKGARKWPDCTAQVMSFFANSNYNQKCIDSQWGKCTGYELEERIEAAVKCEKNQTIA